MKKLLISISTLFILISTGCAVSKDPRQGGFISGVYGIMSGTYDESLEQKKSELKNEQDSNKKLTDRSSVLQSDIQTQKTAIKAEELQVAEMYALTKELEGEIQGLESQSESNKTRISKLKYKIQEHRNQLKKLQSDLKGLSSDGGTLDSGRYNILLKERDRLAKEYRSLIEYTKALSEAAN